jgi:hypothetical protein
LRQPQKQSDHCAKNLKQWAEIKRQAYEYHIKHFKQQLNAISKILKYLTGCKKNLPSNYTRDKYLTRTG